VSGRRNVADYLSRVPGSDKLQPALLCSTEYTLGVRHECDVTFPVPRTTKTTKKKLRATTGDFRGDACDDTTEDTTKIRHAGLPHSKTLQVNDTED